MFLKAAILGLVEGLTEFLPVSSTGHLILAGGLLRFTGEKASTFEIFIQLGAILAVVVFFRRKFAGLFNWSSTQGFSGKRGIALLACTTAPALAVGFLTHHFIKEHLFNPFTVAIGLGIGGLWILASEKWPRHFAKSGLDSLGGREALGVGFFQCLALWPGFSRSAATILGGMTLGLDRKTATEYSFFAAVPVMAAACLLDLIKSRHALSAADLPLFAVGFIVAFFSAWASIQFLLGFVSRHKLNGFGWYRLVLALAVFLFLR